MTSRGREHVRDRSSARPGSAHRTRTGTAAADAWMTAGDGATTVRAPYRN